MVAISLPFTLAEYFALQWRAWAYYPDQVLPIRVGAQVETFVFTGMVILVVAFTTLIHASRIDSSKKPRRAPSIATKHPPLATLTYYA